MACYHSRSWGFQLHGSKFLGTGLHGVSAMSWGKEKLSKALQLECLTSHNMPLARYSMSMFSVAIHPQLCIYLCSRPSPYNLYMINKLRDTFQYTKCTCTCTFCKCMMNIIEGRRPGIKYHMGIVGGAVDKALPIRQMAFTTRCRTAS